jgi:nucleotide-binding universal stress UspA family protein
MYKRIMVPLDGSDLAQSALTHALELGRALEATLLLFYVRDPRSGSVEAAQRYLAFVRDQQAASGVRIEILVGEGPVAAAIIEAAERERIDLIAMATHGRSGMQRVVYGSVAEQILRSSHKPILLVRAPGATVEAPTSSRGH